MRQAILTRLRVAACMVGCKTARAAQGPMHQEDRAL